VLRKGKKFLLLQWHPSCYSCYKPDDKSCLSEWGKNEIIMTTNGANPWSFVTQKIRRIEDTKRVIRIRKSKKDRQHNGQKEKGETTIYKTHIKLNIEKHKTHSKPG